MRNYLILSAILFFYFIKVNCYRLEPFNIHKSREQFYTENFHKFTNKLELDYSIDKGYYCVSKKDILPGESIMEIPRNFTYSTFDDFPLKHKVFDAIRENEIVQFNVNLTGNLLLTTRLMFDLKANVTEMFILMKMYDDKGKSYNFADFKNFLRSRTDFFHSFLKNLPLANIYGQTSWSEDDINDYMLTGFLPLFKSQLVKIYNSIVETFKKDTILNEFTKNWFNESNLSYFLSLYGYVISRSFRITLNDFSLNATKSGLNKEIDELGGSIIIPFIDLCNHYHPKIENEDDSKAQLKLIKINFNENSVKIKSLSNYKYNEEFSFSYSTLLTNDFLLLNYGFLIKNNPFQEFVFKFDIDDPQYKFYKKLQARNFNINQLAVIDQEKLSIHFPLLSKKFSADLLKFIEIFLEMNNYLENEKHSRMKIYQKLKSSINPSILEKIKIYMLYFTTIEKNIKALFDSMDNKNVQSFYDTIIDTENKKDKLLKIIEENTHKFYLSRNYTEGLDDDIQNLFYFKTLQTYIKRNLIQHFNFENLKILYSQQDLALKKVMKYYNDNIKNLKKQYV